MSEELQQKNNFALQVVSAIPILTFLVLLFSGSKQVVYYTSFNFDAGQFLEISEIFQRVVYDICQSYLLILVFVFIAILHFNDFEPNNKNKNLIIIEPKVDIQLENAINEDIKKNSKITLVLVLTALTTLVPIAIGYFTMPMKEFASSSYLFFDANNCILVSSCLIFITFINVFRNSTRRLSKDKSYQILVALSVLLAVNGTLQGYVSFVNVKYNHTTAGSYIITNKGKLVSDNNAYYIGKSKTDVFFYDEKLKIVKVYPVSSIIEMGITQN